MYSKTYSEDDEVLYRPIGEHASNLAHDGIALCAYCTQYHDDIGADAYRAYCADCGKHQVFGHLNFSKI